MGTALRKRKNHPCSTLHSLWSYPCVSLKPWNQHQYDTAVAMVFFRMNASWFANLNPGDPETLNTLRQEPKKCKKGTFWNMCWGRNKIICLGRLLYGKLGPAMLNNGLRQRRIEAQHVVLKSNRTYGVRTLRWILQMLSKLKETIFYSFTSAGCCC